MDLVEHNEQAYPPDIWAEIFSLQKQQQHHPPADTCGMVYCCSRDSLNGEKITYPTLSPDNLGRRKNVRNSATFEVESRLERTP